jgi:hypothetical protein
MNQAYILNLVLINLRVHVHLSVSGGLQHGARKMVFHKEFLPSRTMIFLETFQLIEQHSSPWE